MKKTLLLTIIFLLLCTGASAKRGYGFNGWVVKAGANYSTIVENSNSDIHNSFKAGFTAGLALDWKFTDVIGLSVDVLYSRQGSQANMDIIEKGAKITETSNYINLPVMANLYIVRGLTAKAGIQASYFLSASDEVTGTDSPEKVDLLGAYRTMDVSIPVGVSYEFGFGLIIEGRYNFGLTNIVKTTSAPLEGYKAKNSYASLTVGYRF